MKKIVAIFLICISVVGVFLLVNGGDDNKNDGYLRLHIRANSNSDIDQSVKYIVKAAVVNFLTEKVANATSKEEVVEIINSNIRGIEAVADATLSKQGVNYTASAQINNEFFPTRSYEDLVLKEGYYDALIINLGTGKGDNWWCVVYPPLCFIGATNNGSNRIQYKSKISEIFDNILQ